ncbi:hypothetical protein [Aquimarina rubra]|uniref:Gliding motility-associated protein GldM C-terminal domain-containing protein n=1 Tax=Aquimarina rubra TaxID=1920033 RepID=A0ABW5LBM9_9FLAO
MRKFKVIIPFLFISSSIFCQDNSEPIVEFTNSPKVLYRGILNKVKIYVPKMDSSQVFNANNELLLKDEMELYNINCTTSRAQTKKLIVKSYSNGINIKSDTLNFDIKDIPRPRLRIGGDSGFNLKMTLEELKDAKLEVYIPKFKYDFSVNVSRYRIKIGNEKDILVEGDSISKEVYSKIKKLDIGEEILIFGVGYSSQDSKWRCGKSLGNTYIELMNKR